MNAKEAIHLVERRYEGLWGRLEQMVTAGEYFQLFKQLSDNYSPTLTVSRVQGPLVKSLLTQKDAKTSPVRVTQNLRGSGTIGIEVGEEPAPAWFSGHADICSYLTGSRDGSRYSLI